MPVSLSRLSAALPFLALSACGAGQAESAPASPLVQTVLIGPASAAPLRYTGVVRARIESDLGFRVGGKILQRLVDAGEAVRRGQPLMRLDATDLALSAAAAGNQVRAAQAEASRAAAEETRLRRLVEAGAVSRSAYDAALASARASAASLAAARSAAREASNQRSYGTLVADADGIVVDVLAQPGQVVSAGAPVIRLAQAGSREAAIAVPETQLAMLPREGRALLYGTNTELPARLREVAGTADGLTRTFAARFTLGDAVVPLGATVTVELPRPAGAALEVPLSALHDRGMGPGVWVFRTGRVSFRPVKVIVLGEETASIAPGALAAGERIVALGAHLLREGQGVRTDTAQVARK
jgi:RND family efflux transporter MFP subunit